MNEIIFRFFNNLVGLSPAGDRLIVFLADYFGYLLLLVLIAIIAWSWRREFTLSSIGFIIATTLSAWLLAYIIKYFYFSPRPFLVLTDVQQLIQHGGNDSFPSGHATFFMALAVSLYLVNKRWGNIFIIGAVLIALARVAVGIHWPTDILGGFILAWLVVLAARSLFPQALNKTDQFRGL